MVASSKKQRADKTECAITNWLIIYADAGSLSQRTTTVSCGIHEVHCESQFDFLEILPSTYKCPKKSARFLLCLAQVSKPPLSFGEDDDDALHRSVEIYYIGDTLSLYNKIVRLAYLHIGCISSPCLGERQRKQNKRASTRGKSFRHYCSS